MTHAFVPTRLGAQALLGAWLPGIAAPPRPRASDWIEANIRLASDNNAKPGPLRLFKYQRDMIDLIMAPSVDTVALQLASQVGKSLTIDSLLMYQVVNDPAPMLHLSPDEKMAKKFVRNRINPMVRASPNLRKVFGNGGRGGAGDSLTEKEFAGGSLSTGSSFKPGDVAAASIRIIYLDEVDRFALSVGQEGDPIDLARKRAHMWDDSLVIVASTPTNSTSRINPWFRRGNQNRFFVPCPDCGHFDYYRGEQLTYAPGKFDTARLVCTKCAHRITEGERRAALQFGEWRPTAQGEPGIISFHASALISEAPKSTLANIAQEEAGSAVSPEKKMSYINTWMAEVYTSEDFRVEGDELQHRAISMSPVPAPVIYITAGVDVQHNRLECQIIGHGPFNTAYVLDHVVLMGATTSDAPWDALDELLTRKFDTSDGRRLRIAACAVDSSDQTSMVYARVAELRDGTRRVHPVKGLKGLRGQVTLKKTSTTENGLSLLAVGTGMLKERIMRGLAMTGDDPYRIYLSDHLDMEFFEGICSEVLVTEYVKGYPEKRFKKTRGRNEVLDCAVYALAIVETVPHPIREGRGAEATPFPTINETLNRG